MRRVLCATAITFGVTACSLLTDLDSLTTSASFDEGGVVDAKNDGMGPGGGDGAAEATADGTVESGGDGSAAAFCATNAGALICEDFESTATGIWTPELSGAASMVKTSTTTSTSPTTALESSVATEGPEGRYARWARTLPGSVSKVSFSYSLYIAERPTTSAFEVNILRLGTGNQRSEFYLRIEANRTLFGEQSNAGGRDIQLTQNVPTTKWTRVAIDLDFSGASKKMKVSLDGAVVLEDSSQYGAPGAPNVNVGITYAASQQVRGRVLLDDVLLR